jgi:hypothetical protein
MSCSDVMCAKRANSEAQLPASSGKRLKRSVVDAELNVFPPTLTATPTAHVNLNLLSPQRGRARGRTASRTANSLRRSPLNALRGAYDRYASTFLLPPTKISQHCPNVARELLGVGFPSLANFREDWIGLHGAE